MAHRQSGAIQHEVRQTDRELWNALKKESTVSLVRRIVENADQDALAVLHDTRTVFCYMEKRFRFVEFLDILKEKRRNDLARSGSLIDVDYVVERAYDLTVAKFQNFPVKDKKKKDRKDEGTKPDRGFAENVDCRNYFKAFLIKMEKIRREGKIAFEIDEEHEAGEILKILVFRHFRLSLKECLRNNAHSVPYQWKVAGKKITLYYPRHMGPDQFKAWLEENIDVTEPKTDVSLEKKCIQQRIDEELVTGYSVSFDEPSLTAELKSDDNRAFEDREGRKFVVSLSECVAQEKSEHCEELRPAIRALGAKGVYSLVLRVFADINEGAYSLSEVAQNFGLSKASLSRFAGPAWSGNAEQEIPDLWANTARVLAGNAMFSEVVENAGFADVIDGVLTMIEPRGECGNGYT